jgi:hypothetical protein
VGHVVVRKEQLVAGIASVRPLVQEHEHGGPVRVLRQAAACARWINKQEILPVCCAAVFCPGRERGGGCTPLSSEKTRKPNGWSQQAEGALTCRASHRARIQSGYEVT